MRSALPSRGFSVIEVVIALFIVGITLVLLQSIPRTLTLARLTKDQDVALRIADSKMEAVRSGGYAAVPASGSFSDSGLSSLPSGSGTLTVTDFNAKTKKIVVAVSWQEPSQGVPSSVSLTTLVTQIGALP